jgi:hypothetical protein
LRYLKNDDESDTGHKSSTNVAEDVK